MQNFESISGKRYRNIQANYPHIMFKHFGTAHTIQVGHAKSRSKQLRLTAYHDTNLVIWKAWVDIAQSFNF